MNDVSNAVFGGGGFEAEWEPSGEGETSADGCPESASTKTNQGRPSSGGGQDGGAEDSGLGQAAERGLGEDLPLRWMQKQKRSIPERAGAARLVCPLDSPDSRFGGKAA